MFAFLFAVDGRVAVVEVSAEFLEDDDAVITEVVEGRAEVFFSVDATAVAKTPN